jgi:hypothetical protein
MSKARTGDGVAEGRRRAAARVAAVRREFLAGVQAALAEPPGERDLQVAMAVTRALGSIGTIRVDPYIDAADLDALMSVVDAYAVARPGRTAPCASWREEIAST